MSELAVYESKNEIREYLDTENPQTRELAKQIQKFVPGIDKLPTGAQWAFAAICLGYDVDPVVGEAWAWMGNKGPTMMIGIAGRRRKAREMLREETGNPVADFSTEFVRVDSAEYGCEPGDFVYECKLYDDKSSTRWLNEYVKLKSAGFGAAEASAIIGERPFTLGIGICRLSESTKMEKNEAARKRAEANALKQRFDLRFPDVVQEIALNANGDDEKYAALLADEPHEPKTKRQAISALGFDVEPEDEPDIIEGEAVEDDPFQVTYPAHLMKVCTKDGEPYPDLSDDRLKEIIALANENNKKQLKDAVRIENNKRLAAAEEILKIRVEAQQPALM